MALVRLAFVNHKRFLWAFVAWTLSLVPASPAESPHLHTTRSSGKLLPLPKEEDVFHFIVFGDRTGGPAEGIKVLAQGVEDANLLAPDLVMTVGDLVNGYNQTDAWMKQMEEYQSTMGKLKMPWFPVAGNHDIYWRRSARNPEPKPPREHEDSYEKHFGPLWYWFEHKDTGFLVLFSDEGHPDGRTRSFSDPAQQRFSKTQMDWIAAELEKMKRLKNIFVFLHHPRWVSDIYPGSNWDEVHQLLVKNGKVRAVLVGHIHQMRYDGERDGIGYYALAATGASMTPGMEYRYFGLVHHFNVVTVRDTRYSIAAVPVGAVFDPKQFTPARLEDVEAARYTLHQFVSPPVAIHADGSASSMYQVMITNPCTMPIDVTILGKGAKSWTVAPDHRHAELKFRESRTFEFACFRDSKNALEGFEAPEFELRFDVLTPEGRLAMPVWSLRGKTHLLPPDGGWPVLSTNRCLALNGTNACLEIDQASLAPQDGPFTVEAWVKPADDQGGSIVGNITIGGFVLDVQSTPRFSVQTNERPADARHVFNIGPWISARAAEKLPLEQWSHLAGVYDGEQIILYVNGRKAAATPVRGARLDSDKALYVGARPNTGWNVHNFSYPAAFWKGSVDDVRLSRTARYQASFVPEQKLAADASALLVLANDLRYGPFVPVAARSPVQALLKGDPQLPVAGR